MTNCVVATADIGLEIVQSGTGTPWKSVSYCNFEDISQTGVSVNNFSNLMLTDNSIAPVTPVPNGSVGIICDAASPRLLRNYIKGFGLHGLYCANASSPVLESGMLGGHNVITETGYITVHCENASNAILGLDGPYVDDEGGQNSIFGGSDFDVNLKESDVAAEWNWWGTPDDPAGQFALDGSTIDYTPWLEEDPGDARPEAFGLPDESISSFSPQMRLVMGKRTYSEFDTCNVMLRAMVADRTLEDGERQWALHQLLAVSQMMQGSGLGAYLRSVITTHPVLTDAVKAILPAALFHEGDINGALQAYDDNITDYSDGMRMKAALYGKFLHALYNESDSAGARVLLGRLENIFPFSVETQMGHVEIQSFIPRSPEVVIHTGDRSLRGGRVLTPQQFELSQNYPNPFNPATTIRYTLADPSFVSLRVYDLLGREVKRLVDEVQNPGSHSAVFDASGLASGIYFYKLQAGAFTAVKRMVIVK